MRCNVGVEPRFLADQHLIAEYRELNMVVGSLRLWDWEIKSVIPDEFNLGIGHMNFLKNKLRYLQRRHEHVISEMKFRGFKCDLVRVVLDGIDPKFCNDWVPTKRDSDVIRQRIYQKILMKPEFYKYFRNPIMKDIDSFLFNLLNGDVYLV